MSLSLAIAVNVIADLAILGLLAFVMTRTSLLKPHNANLALKTAPRPAGRLATRRAVRRQVSPGTIAAARS